MKICQLCAVDFTLHTFLLPLMRGMREAGHEVVGVCADGPLLAGVRAQGFTVETVPFVRGYKPLAHLRAFRALVRIFRRENFDLVHTHTPIGALIGRLAAAWAGVPRIVYTAHGFYFHDRMPLWKRALFMALEFVPGRFTDILFTQSAEDAATARQFRMCRGGIVEAIGNGADPARFHPVADGDRERNALRRQLDTPDEAVVIVTVGRLVAEKGYPELFTAMREVNAILWAVGERLPSDHAAGIEAAIETAQSDPNRRVRLLGYRPDIPHLLRAADIFVLASHREGMPRSIIEAMFTGLPVVATDIRGCREEVAAESTGILVPFEDRPALAAALNRLVVDRSLRARMGAAGRERAIAHYDETKVVARQIELLGLAATHTR